MKRGLKLIKVVHLKPFNFFRPNPGPDEEGIETSTLRLLITSL